VALAGAAALSTLGGRTAATAAGEVMRLAAMAVMLLVVERLVADDPNRRGPLLGAAFASAVAPVVMTAVQLGTGHGMINVHGLLRPHGTFWHPNVLGVYCALMLTMAAGLLPHLETRHRGALGVLATGLGVGLVAGYARGAWLAALAGLVVVALLTDRRILAVLGVAVLVPIIAVPSVRDRITDLGDASPGASESSLTWRFEHWSEVLHLIGGNPVTGIGPGTARAALGKEVHNDYLRALAETGVVGLLAYLALLAALVLTARAALLATTDPRRAGPAPARSIERGVAVGFAGTVAVVAVFALADNVMTTVAVQWYLAAFAGIALATVRTDPAGGMRPIGGARRLGGTRPSGGAR
ncbi:O-antigen ligase family protein, partial [Actinomadura roseirufa]|uniref:O-antigen ligase family protein n=1 Tax=Actinomadura roseirufa TaxID=2094049 RepID=UPI0010410082